MVTERKSNRSKFCLVLNLVFYVLTALFVAPRLTAGKSADKRKLSPRNEKDSLNHWLPWLEIERGKIQIQSEGWESCGGEGGTCVGSVI